MGYEYRWRHTECQLSQSNSLACELPCARFPWKTLQDFFEFNEIRVWGKTKNNKTKQTKNKTVPQSEEGKTEKRFTSQNSPYITHSSLPGLFCFSSDISIHFHCRAFAFTVFSATRISSQILLPQKGLSSCSHSQDVMFLLCDPSLFPCTALLYFTEFFATWSHIIGCDPRLLKLLVTGFLVTRI